MTAAARLRAAAQAVRDDHGADRAKTAELIGRLVGEADLAADMLDGDACWWLGEYGTEHLSRVAAAMEAHGDDLANVVYMLGKPWKYGGEWAHVDGQAHDRKTCTLCDPLDNEEGDTP